MSELRERELRDLLERASDIDGEVDPDREWAVGRRRRARRGTGMALAAGVAAVAVVGGLVQTGVLGGTGPTPTGPAAVPDGYTTFVFAAPGATGGQVPGAGSLDVSVPAADDLEGTSWVLADELWHTDVPAAQVVGADPGTTTLEFGGAAGRGWGFVADACGGGWFQEDLTLTADGRFPAGGLGSDDQGCPPDAQAAEDFWIQALSGGGYLRELGDDWLLLSVVVPTSTETEAPTSPGPSETSGTTSPTSPTSPTSGTETATSETGGTQAPTGDGSPQLTTGGTAGPTATGEGEDEAGGPAWVDPGQETVDQPWPAAGGDLLAPTVRAGRHDGFDRVVVDLEGDPGADPGWRAAYTDDPRLDGSGAPAGVAGDSVLEVVLSGTGYPDPGSDVYAEGTYVLDTHSLAAVVEVQRTAPFEGMLQLFVGVQGEPRPYRVFLLQDPMRLVVDVQTS